MTDLFNDGPGKQNSDKPLRLEYLDPSELKKNPQNWRTHPKAQRKALVSTIKDVGWAGALLLNEKTGNLIDGHLRKEAFENSGNGSLVPVLVGSWTPEEEKKILATLDPLGSLALQDDEALDKLLSDISSESIDFNEILGLSPEVKPKKSKPLRERWGIESGQTWILGKDHLLQVGDVTDKKQATKIAHMLEKWRSLTGESPKLQGSKERSPQDAPQIDYVTGDGADPPGKGILTFKDDEIPDLFAE